MDAVVLDSIINRLLQLRILEAEICELCVVSSKIFLQQPNLLELEAPINVCGDIHGQYSDLLRFFDRGGFPPAGSVETMCLLLAYKIRYPDSFFLLRGNHDCESMARMWGFRDECKARFNARLWRLFVACFDCLPAAAIIGGKVICLHGGLSPVLTDLDQIRAMARPADVPLAGLLCDILWSDPSKEVPRWGLKVRGFSYIFGAEVVSEFLHRNGLALLCRSHQVVKDGHELVAHGQLVTIFSAPSYRDQFDSAAAIMSIDENLMYSFQLLKRSTKRSNFFRTKPMYKV
ncbi:unnamed protein product [Spirodela intermedia]|uniref:protein-serine/threonine phosphatase n=1 Tax=Spirodela intermedia TaxID=51605 RepID=A0A7I8JGK0_SPIIN|nr:unnamed protein product [Spirodela intermedia]CAA6668663.1 unnamed protein product [Spirodela intermedia]